MQESLGGSHTLRGYQNFRFRGEKILLLQAEYRWEAVPAVELALFVDGGQALRAGEDFDLGDLETDYGFGIRLKRNTGLIARLDVARSGEDRRVLLRFGPSF
jgi:hemolysin activation/secretion protein